ncbi:MAG: hypothetical protein D6772_04015, partial [Bacteroidetes bacterium]
MVKFKHFLWWWWMLLSGLSSLLGQTLIYEYYGVDEGLSSRLVEDIIFDQCGYVWIATENGLDRFDGDEFQHFSHLPNSTGPAVLSYDKVVDLALTADGKIMIFYERLSPSFDVLDPISLEVKKVDVGLKVKASGKARAFYC